MRRLYGVPPSCEDYRCLRSIRPSCVADDILGPVLDWGIAWETRFSIGERFYLYDNQWLCVSCYTRKERQGG